MTTAQLTTSEQQVYTAPEVSCSGQEVHTAGPHVPHWRPQGTLPPGADEVCEPAQVCQEAMPWSETRHLLHLLQLTWSR